MSVSTGTRKERNVQSRTNEAIIEGDKALIAGYKIFSDSSNSVAGLAGSAINNSPKTPAGNYLAREGDSMIGPFALGPPVDFTIEVDANNTIDIGPLNDNPFYASNLQLDDLQPNSSVLDIIANPAFDGQELVLRTFAPTVPYTISQGTVGNGGNIQTGDSNDLVVGDLQTVVLRFDESLIINANTGGTWRVESTSTVITGANGHVIQDEGIALPQQPNLNFVGPGVTATNDGPTNATIVTIPGSSNVPDGTVINDHLEWNGAAWIAQQFMEFGTVASPNPASGKLRFGNAQLLTWSNVADDTTFSFGVGANDFFNIINTKLDMNSEDIIAVDRLGFSQLSQAPAQPSDEVIYLDANGDMTFNVDTGSGFRWDFLNVNKALLTEVGATPDPAFILFGSNDEIPTMRVQREDSTPVTGPAGTVGKVEWWGVDSTGVTLEEFGRIEVEAADLTVGNVSGAMNLRVERNDNSTVFMTLNDSDDDKITVWKNLFFQTAIDAELNDNDLWLDNGLNTKLSGTQTGFNVTVDGTFVATFGSNSLVMQPDKDITTRAVLHTPTDAVFTTNGQIWYDLSENKFKGRENGVTVDLVGGAGSGANTFLSNLTSPTAINEDILPGVTGTLHLGGVSNIWDDLFTEEVRFFTGGTIGNRNAIMADAGGMVYLTEDTLVHEFFVNGQTSVEIGENEINFTDSGRQHQIIANASNFQFITEVTGDGLEVWTGASRSNATVNIEDGVTEFLTNDTSLNPYRLQIIQNNDTPATQRVIGSLDGLAENTSSADIIYGRIEFSTADSVTAGSENGRIGIEVRSDGANVPVITVAGDGGSAGGELAFFSLATVPQQSVASDTLANLYTALRNYKLIA